MLDIFVTFLWCVLSLSPRWENSSRNGVNMSQQSVSLFFCTINIHHTERNPLLCVLFLVSSPSRRDEGNVNSVWLCVVASRGTWESVCMCVYERERETDGLLMLRRGSLSQRVLLWALEAKEARRRGGETQQTWCFHHGTAAALYTERWNESPSYPPAYRQNT